MGPKDELVGTFAGVNALYINTPGVENRAELAVATAEAAKEAGVKHVVVVSVPSADLPDTVYIRQAIQTNRGKDFITGCSIYYMGTHLQATTSKPQVNTL